VLARFSVGGGSPKVADTNNLVLRGFSFKLGDDDHRSDILVESAPVHFARTLDQMLAFLKVRIPGPDGKPDMEKVKAFSAANPETLHQANYIAARRLPGSFAGTTYWGVHSFPATNSKGQTRFIKFKVVPAGGDVTLTEEEAKTKSADFLHDDLEHRIAAGDVRFNVMALIDRPGDPTMDVTMRWPDEDSREFPASTFLPTLNPIEPPWYGPVCPVVWEGWRREASPYPDHRRIFVVAAPYGEGLFIHPRADLCQIPLPRIAGKVDRNANVSRTGAAQLVAASPSSAGHTAGVIFWFIRKKLVGSYLALSSVSRA